jgi:hypothetical protein
MSIPRQIILKSTGSRESQPGPMVQLDQLDHLNLLRGRSVQVFFPRLARSRRCIQLFITKRVKCRSDGSLNSMDAQLITRQTARASRLARGTAKSTFPAFYLAPIRDRRPAQGNERRVSCASRVAISSRGFRSIDRTVRRRKGNMGGRIAAAGNKACMESIEPRQ